MECSLWLCVGVVAGMVRVSKGFLNASPKTVMTLHGAPANQPQPSALNHAEATNAKSQGRKAATRTPNQTAASARVSLRLCAFAPWR